MKFSQNNFENWRFWKVAILKTAILEFFCFCFIPMKMPKLLGYQGWVEILKITLVYSKRVSVRNNLLHSVPLFITYKNCSFQLNKGMTYLYFYNIELNGIGCIFFYTYTYIYPCQLNRRIKTWHGFEIHIWLKSYFSNFSCMFLNPNIFFRFEVLLF